MKQDSQERFSKQVDNYVKYRPHYPTEILNYLQNKYAIHPDMAVADIGSGTGISSKLFLDKGYQVFGIEPNENMRLASTKYLSNYEKFTAINGSAAKTTMQSNCVDIILAGQAFHWFNNEATKIEFERISKEKRLIVFLWNERNTKSDFEKEYDHFIERYALDYIAIKDRNIEPQNIELFLAPNPCELITFDNSQTLDFEGLKGRLLSSSFIPQQEHIIYEEMIEKLYHLFSKYKENNTITINYLSKVYSSPKTAPFNKE